MELNKKTIKEISFGLNEPKETLKKRLEAFESFQRLPLPEFRYGMSIVIDASGLDINKVAEGGFSEEGLKIKNNGIVIEETKNPSEYFFSELTDKISAFHRAFYTNSTTIKIPAKTLHEKPVFIENQIKKTSLKNILIIAEGGSEATLVFDLLSSGREDFLSSEFMHIVVKENAKLNILANQEIGKNIFNFSKKNATVLGNGELNIFTCELGSRLTKSEITASLTGQKARVKNHSIFFGDGKQQYDIFMSTVHEAKDTTSNMLTKGALKERARSVYRGRIKINKDAGGSNGYQKGDTLILSDEAEADAIPYLEIDNNDVKCSHGATVGQVDKNKIFYMETRGVDEREASRVLTKGFFEPMLKDMPEHMANKIRISLSKRVG